MWRTGRQYVRTYRTNDYNQDNRKTFNIIFGIILVIVAYFWLTNEHYEKEMKLAFDEVYEQIHYPHKDNVNEYNSGNLIYFTTDNIVPSDTLVDQEFQFISPANSIKMKRIEEYCQWIETASTSTVKDDNGNTHEITTYHYYKAWVPTPIISVFYNQPMAHHNPLHQPFPSKEWATNTLKAGDYQLNNELISSMNDFHNYEFSQSELSNYLGSTANYHRFNYIGGGYFYFAYEEQTSFKLARMFGEFLEGSLLDFQLYDLFPYCTAGDVRVHFEVSNPHQITVIGKQLTESGDVGIWVTSRDFRIGYITEGILSVEEVFDKVLNDHHWTVLILRSIVCFILFLLTCTNSEIEFPNLLVFTFTLSAFVALLSSLFLALYPFSIFTFLSMISSSVALYLHRTMWITNDNYHSEKNK